MRKYKPARHVSICGWLSARKDNTEGRFVQVGNSLLLSPSFQALSPNAQHLYLCMAMESAGCREFRFPLASAIKYGFSESTFRRSVRELVSNRFITLKSSGRLTREPNDYEFCFDWKLYNVP